MTAEIKTITTPFVFHVSVNCFLIKIDDGYVLIDTGITSRRSTIEKELESAGCRPGNLKLIILTHGDFDHCGNAAYFRQKFGTKIAMHASDSGMLEYGDMFWNRKQPNKLVKMVFSLLFRLNQSDRCKPDVYLEDGDDLASYGFAAQVLHLPGHSAGSIGILTADGKLFAGDLLANVDRPEIWPIIDDPQAAQASVDKLRSIEIDTVYPKHGKPFLMKQFI
jgi:glyoxylase-like metal-dependent hydrolase (beta-lactamase superfamily II)